MGSKLDKAFADIDKELGKGIVQDASTAEDVKRLVSRSMGMNYIFNGGTPRGRIIELYGPESGGKSLLATTVAVDFQRAGEFVVYIDLEGTFISEFSERLGLSVDPKQFRLLQPETGEDAFESIEMLAKTGEVGYIIVDSVAAMIPKSELEGDYGESSVGTMARLMSQGMRKLNSIVRKSNTTVLFINQIRQKIGVTYGSPETTTGGNSLKFYASSRNRISRKDTLKDGKDVVGIQMGVTNKKSKIGPPLREFTTNVYFENGIDMDTELADFGAKLEVLTKSGSWYDMPDGERIQGKTNVSKYLSENPETRKRVFKEIYQRLFGFEPDWAPTGAEATPTNKVDTEESSESETPKKRKSSKKAKEPEIEIEVPVDDGDEV